jgi:uncharacterized protein (DUF1501 family)
MRYGFHPALAQLQQLFNLGSLQWSPTSALSPGLRRKARLRKPFPQKRVTAR